MPHWYSFNVDHQKNKDAETWVLQDHRAISLEHSDKVGHVA